MTCRSGVRLTFQGPKCWARHRCLMVGSNRSGTPRELASGVCIAYAGLAPFDGEALRHMAGVQAPAGRPRLSMDTSHLAWFLRSSIKSAPGERRAAMRFGRGRMARRRGSGAGLLLIGGVLLVVTMCRGEGSRTQTEAAPAAVANAYPTASTAGETHAGHGQRAKSARHTGRRPI